MVNGHGMFVSNIDFILNRFISKSDLMLLAAPLVDKWLDSLRTNSNSSIILEREREPTEAVKA